MAVSDTQPVGLVVGAVGTRHDFLVLVGAGNPRFKVVFLGGHRAHITGANVDHLVVNAEAVPQVDAVLEQLFVQRPGVFRL